GQSWVPRPGRPPHDLPSCRCRRGQWPGRTARDRPARRGGADRLTGTAGLPARRSWEFFASPPVSRADLKRGSTFLKVRVHRRARGPEALLVSSDPEPALTRSERWAMVRAPLDEPVARPERTRGRGPALLPWPSKEASRCPWSPRRPWGWRRR